MRILVVWERGKEDGMWKKEYSQNKRREYDQIFRLDSIINGLSCLIMILQLLTCYVLKSKKVFIDC